MTAYPPALTIAACSVMVLLVSGSTYLVAAATDHLAEDVMGLLRLAMGFGAFTTALSVVVSVTAYSVREHQTRGLAALATEVHALRGRIEDIDRNLTTLLNHPSTDAQPAASPTNGSPAVNSHAWQLGREFGRAEERRNQRRDPVGG